MVQGKAKTMAIVEVEMFVGDKVKVKMKRAEKFDLWFDTYTRQCVHDRGFQSVYSPCYFPVEEKD